MRKLIVASLLSLVALTSSINAQTFGSAEIDRGLRYYYTAPYDATPYTERYGFGSGAFLYFNGNSQNLYLMDYYDKLDRAEKFGYAPPADPFAQPAPTIIVSPRVEFGYGLFRGRH